MKNGKKRITIIIITTIILVATLMINTTSERTAGTFEVAAGQKLGIVSGSKDDSREATGGSRTEIVRLGQYFTCADQPTNDMTGDCTKRNVFKEGDVVWSYARVHLPLAPPDSIYQYSKESYMSNWPDLYNTVELQPDWEYIWFISSSQYVSCLTNGMDVKFEPQYYLEGYERWGISVTGTCSDGVCQSACGETESNCATDCPYFDDANSKVLPLSYQSRGTYSWDGAAVISMITGFYGEQISQNEIMKTLRSDRVYAFDATDYLRAAGYSVKGLAWTPGEVKASVDSGKPVLVTYYLDSSKKYATFGIIAGYIGSTPTHYIVYDSARGIRVYTTDNFNSLLLSELSVWKCTESNTQNCDHVGERCIDSNNYCSDTVIINTQYACATGTTNCQFGCANNKCNAESCQDSWDASPCWTYTPAEYDVLRGRWLGFQEANEKFVTVSNTFYGG
jgi:hypothetical protein